MALERQQTTTVEEYFLLEKNNPVPVIDAYEGINPKEDFPSREDKTTS